MQRATYEVHIFHHLGQEFVHLRAQLQKLTISLIFHCSTNLCYKSQLRITAKGQLSWP